MNANSLKGTKDPFSFVSGDKHFPGFIPERFWFPVCRELYRHLLFLDKHHGNFLAEIEIEEAIAVFARGGNFYDVIIPKLGVPFEEVHPDAIEVQRFFLHVLSRNGEKMSSGINHFFLLLVEHSQAHPALIKK